MESPTSFHGPYEDFGIKSLDVILELIKGQPPDVKADLWRMYVEDLKDWRAFWKGVASMFKKEEKV